MNKDFFISNREQLKNLLKEDSIIVLFAGEAPKRSADQNYLFTPNRNFYYITGIEEEKAIYVAFKTKNAYKQYLFIEEGDSALEKWMGKKITPEEAKEISGIEEIKYLKSFEPVFDQEVMALDTKTLYLDLEKRNYDAIPNYSFLFAEEVKKNYPQLLIETVYKKISRLRMKKSEQEIEKLQQAINITEQGINELMKQCKSGIYEYQLEAYFDFTLKTLGAKNRAFNTIAASGVNATVLHYEKNSSLLEDGQLILFDLGAEFENYCADISRTIPVNGKFTKRQKEVYNVVLRSLLETTEIVKPGVTFKELNEHAKRILAIGCKELGIIKDENELSKYYYHGVGHFLGLDTHDVGDYMTPLESGMVITIEPGLYLEEEGLGIRIEDDVLVTEEGNIVLSDSIIKTVEEIEEFMTKKS